MSILFQEWSREFAQRWRAPSRNWRDWEQRWNRCPCPPPNMPWPATTSSPRRNGSANLARYDGVKFGYSYQDTPDMWQAMESTRQQGFGPEVKRRIMLGTYALSSGYYDAYYLKAQQVRTLIRQDFSRVFEQVDVLVTPTLAGGGLPPGRQDRRPPPDVPD